MKTIFLDIETVPTEQSLREKGLLDKMREDFFGPDWPAATAIGVTALVMFFMNIRKYQVPWRRMSRWALWLALAMLTATLNGFPQLLAAYPTEIPLKTFIAGKNTRPADMKEGDYDRTIAARAFDVTRYLLPLAVRTNVGQVVSIRTLEKQIARLLSSQLPELRAIGEELKEACQRPPMNVWGELSGQTVPADPLAVLALHRPAIDLQRADRIRLRREGVPAVVAADALDQRDVGVGALGSGGAIELRRRENGNRRPDQDVGQGTRPPAHQRQRSRSGRPHRPGRLRSGTGKVPRGPRV